MEDGETNEGDTGGEKPNNDSTPVEEVTKNYEALKEANDKVEAELLRGEELKAKIALGGKSSAGTEVQTPKEEMKKKAEEGAKEIVDAFR